MVPERRRPAVNSVKTPGVDAHAARGAHETTMLHPEGEDKGFVQFSGLFAIAGRNAGEVFEANGDLGLSPDMLLRSESGGCPSSA